MMMMDTRTLTINFKAGVHVSDEVEADIYPIGLSDGRSEYDDALVRFTIRMIYSSQ